MIEFSLWLVSAAFLLAHLASVGLYLHRLRQKPPVGLIGQPMISLLRPVCGLDSHDAETLASSFLQNYPDYEILFCAARADDAAVPLLRRLILENPLVPARILIGDTDHCANPKLDNVWKGWIAARSDWICMADANLLLPPNYLATLVQCWGPNTGLVSSPAIGTRPIGAGGHLEAAFLNSNQARLQFAGDSLGKGYAQGKTLFFNRPVLERAGGLVALHCHLAEDASATIAIRSLGMRVSLPCLPYEQPIGRKSLQQVWKRQLRWSHLRHEAFPLLFYGEIVNGALVPTCLFAAASAFTGAPISLLLAWILIWYGVEAILIHCAGWPAKLADFIALPARDLLLPALWGATFLTKGFEWRGTVTVPSVADSVNA